MTADATPADRTDPTNTIAPLDGEPGIPSVAEPTRHRWDWKGILALAMAVGMFGYGATVWLNRAFSTEPDKDATAQKRSSERPSAATASPRRLDLAVAAPPPASIETPAHRVPAIEPIADDTPAKPIAVRRTAQPGSSKKQALSPEDAPVMLVAAKPSRQLPAAKTQDDATPDRAPEYEALTGARRNLQTYQRQLQGLLDRMNPKAGEQAVPAALANGPFAAPGSRQTTSNASTAPALFGGQLLASRTPKTIATDIGNRSLTLPKGTAFTCVLKTKVVSAVSGFVGCQTQRNVYGDDGRVLLIERGSHLDGEYRITSVKPGTVRIHVLWTRIRTPHGVSVDIASPGTGPLGESGIDGHVDNRWGERIGAAMLLSLIDDSVKLLIQQQADPGSGNTVVLPSTTANTSRLAEKVLDSTINIPPLIYQNQGGIVGIYVARDVDFSSVYALEAVPR